MIDSILNLSQRWSVIYIFETFILNSIQFYDNTVLNIYIDEVFFFFDTINEWEKKEGVGYINIHLFISMSCLFVIDSFCMISQI